MYSLGEISYKFCGKRIIMNSVMGKEPLRILWRKNHYSLCGKEQSILWERTIINYVGKSDTFVGKNHFELCVAGVTHK